MAESHNNTAALDGFHPLVREWFLGQFAGPTGAQAEGWDAIAKGRDPLQPGPPPTPGVGLLVCIAGLVAQRAGAVALQLPSHRRWRAIHTCCDMPDRGALGT